MAKPIKSSFGNTIGTNSPECILPGDRIQTLLDKSPDVPQHGSDYMEVVWISKREDGTKVIWVKRQDNA